MSWLRQRLFATPLEGAITLLCVYVVWRIVVPLLHWLVLDATWHGATREDCKGDGACWVFIRARFGQFMYGQYPGPERWRVDLVGVLCALFGYGWRQYAGYQNAKHACNLRLTQSLYFQTLANNVGVLHYLIDEAEEQDTREAILAYYFLWTAAGPSGMTMAELDAAIERDIELKTGKSTDFEVDDALAIAEQVDV